MDDNTRTPQVAFCFCPFTQLSFLTTSLPGYHIKPLAGRRSRPLFDAIPGSLADAPGPVALSSVADAPCPVASDFVAEAPYPVASVDDLSCGVGGSDKWRLALCITLRFPSKPIFRLFGVLFFLAATSEQANYPPLSLTLPKRLLQWHGARSVVMAGAGAPSDLCRDFATLHMAFVGWGVVDRLTAAMSPPAPLPAGALDRASRRWRVGSGRPGQVSARLGNGGQSLSPPAPGPVRWLPLPPPPRPVDSASAKVTVIEAAGAARDVATSDVVTATDAAGDLAARNMVSRQRRSAALCSNPAAACFPRTPHRRRAAPALGHRAAVYENKVGMHMVFERTGVSKDMATTTPDREPRELLP